MHMPSLMHSGRVYAITENHLPFDIDISTLQTLGSWDVNGGWTRPFTSHAKKAPRSGELVMMGFHHQKPFFEVGIISADGQKVVHKADLKFNRCTFCHEIGVTLRSIKYDSKEFARIGVMPRHGDADSVTWFETLWWSHVLYFIFSIVMRCMTIALRSKCVALLAIVGYEIGR
nr:carotenoid 9,10(9',10')-cleavage dioxygenase 1-like [Ipomoea batatas]